MSHESPESPWRWRKLGRIFAPDGRHPWMQHYAQVPTPWLLGDRIRVFFTCRPAPEADGNFVSHTTFLDVDAHDPTRVLYVHHRPVLPLGGPGSFDQFGVMPCSLLRRDGALWLYYVGWARTRGVPWQSAVGLAVSHDDGLSFQRHAPGPVLTRTPHEPYVQGSPLVLDHGGRLHLWYLSGTDWVEQAGRWESVYRLMHATSDDGVVWQRDGRPCVPTLFDGECQARPAVLLRGGRAHLWFSVRHGVDFRNPQRGYSIGYASSTNLEEWERADHLAGLDKSTQGWDSEMVSYPAVLRVGARWLMFYCGNHMGRDGFGVAETAAS